MRYSQVKAVTFEKNIKVTVLTATFYSLVVLLSCGLLDIYFKTRNNFPVGFAILVPTTLSYTYTCPIIWSQLHLLFRYRRNANIDIPEQHIRIREFESDEDMLFIRFISPYAEKIRQR